MDINYFLYFHFFQLMYNGIFSLTENSDKKIFFLACHFLKKVIKKMFQYKKARGDSFENFL
ncbi:hypothetical protein C923_05165 [Plasmodium falciparum UGT5.1]|uniref:Uncharacterized protein n=1 Tax=Plasmodium falciparum UGT5.1 TaxID=1237627 RepID=W7JHQ1_PLAFA|nr:hypothetical protein C923_05165 [Plasmodium falciparum UGT5.1]